MLGSNIKRSLLFLLFFALISLGPFHSVFGCTTPPPDPPKPWIVSSGVVELYPCGPKYVVYWILFHEFTTFGAQPGQFCACALNVGGPIVSVLSVGLIDSETGAPLPGFEFFSNPNLSNSVSRFAEAGNFSGFISSISQTVPPGLSADLMVCVLTKPKTTFCGLSNYLAKSGVLAVGETDENGNFGGSEHTSIINILPGEQGSFQFVMAPSNIGALRD